MATTPSTKAPARRPAAKRSPAKRAPAKRPPRRRRPEPLDRIVLRHVDRCIAGLDYGGGRRTELALPTIWTGKPLLRTPLPATYDPDPTGELYSASLRPAGDPFDARARAVEAGAEFYYDAPAVEKVLRSFRALHQLIGRHAGLPFVLLDWQVRYLIAVVFGLKRTATGRRVIRTVWFEIPRKNGKSTLCSGLALYLLAGDGEQGAQVYTAAGDRSQAGIVFGPCRDMAAGSPQLARRLTPAGIRRHYLEHPPSGSILRALSSDGARQHGLNVHGAIVDEVHVHRNPDLIDALETGVGSREQPLVVFITTADDGVDGSIYATKREYLEGIVSGTIVDPTFYGVVFGVDHTAAGFDPFATETLVAANPGTDVTVLLEYLEAKAEEARQSPSQLNRYLRLHLNVRTKQTMRWLPLDRWDAAAGNGLDPAHLFHGRPSYGGLDLSSTTDFTAFAFITQLVDEAAIPTEGYAAHVLHWIPEERADELERKTGVPLGAWREAGWLRFTEGNVVDYAQVRADIRAEAELLGTTLVEVAFDPWNASETVNEMQNEGLTMVPIRQGYASLSAPSKELERLVMGSTTAAPLLIHGANPVLRWMADNVEVHQDPAGNIKPAKPDRRKSTKRVDGIAALVNALARAMLRPPPRKARRVAGF